MTTMNHLNNFAEIDSKTFSELQRTADELLEVGHLDFENTEYLAKVLFSLGRHDESVEQLERMLSVKTDESILTSIGVNHFHKRDYETALKYFTKSLEMNPESEMILSYMMLSHEFLENFKEAIRCGEKLVEINSKNASAITRLIDCHLRLREYDSCVYYLNLINYKDKVKKSEILFECGRYEECIEVARNVATAESYHLAARACLKLKNTVKAVKYLYRSYEKDLNPDTLFEIADIYFEVEDFKRSVHFLKEALLHDDKNGETYCRIAYAYLRSSDWHDAVEYAKKAIEIDRKLPKPYIILSEAYIQLEDGHVEKSTEIIEEAIREIPDSPELWAERGGLAYCIDPITFSTSYEKAISLQPKDSKIYVEYINLLIVIGEVEAAKLCYNRLLLVNPLFEKSFEDFQKRAL